MSQTTTCTSSQDCRRGLRVGLRPAPAVRRWIELTGALTEQTSPHLSEVLDEALEQDDRIVVDLRSLDAIDSGAVRLLLIAHLRAVSDRRQLTLIPGPPDVQEVIDQINGPFAYADVS